MEVSWLTYSTKNFVFKSLKYKIIGVGITDKIEPYNRENPQFFSDSSSHKMQLNSDLILWGLQKNSNNESFDSNLYLYRGYYSQLSMNGTTIPINQKMKFLSSLFYHETQNSEDPVKIKFDNPSNMFIISSFKNEVFSFIIRPHRRFLKKANDFLLINIPYCLMRCKIISSLKSHKLFIIKDNVAVRWPYGNVYQDGTICYGDVNKKKLQLLYYVREIENSYTLDLDSYIYEQYSSFFNSTFNNDLVNTPLTNISVNKNEWTEKEKEIYKLLTTPKKSG
jgi:hypothetical protein